MDPASVKHISMNNSLRINLYGDAAHVSIALSAYQGHLAYTNRDTRKSSQLDLLCNSNDILTSLPMICCTCPMVPRDFSPKFAYVLDTLGSIQTGRTNVKTTASLLYK